MSAGAAIRPFSLEDKYLVERGEVYLTGIQALVRVLLDQRRADRRAGLRSATLVSGYPGSPIGGFDLELSRRKRLLDEHDVVHQMGVNEELAATAVMGSQIVAQLPAPKYDGVVGFWYGKANGFDRAMDALRQANLCGTSPGGGAVAIVGDDPTAKSSPTPGASEIAASALLMPMLYPGDVQEILDLGLHAVAMSRCSGLWSSLKLTTNVADGSGTALVDPDRVQPAMVQAHLDGRPYVHLPSAHLYGESVLGMERSAVYARIEAALEYSRANDLNRILLSDRDDRLGIVAPGKTFYELRQALRMLDLDDAELGRLGIRLLHLRMPYPLDGKIVREFALGLSEVLVLEDKRPFVELLIKDELYGLTDRPAVLGKLDEHGTHLVPLHHELDPVSIASLVAGRISRLGGAPSLEDRLAHIRPVPGDPLPLARTPFYCSGCPHNSSTTAVPEGATIGAGTGCHVLSVFMPREQVGDVVGLTAMGNEGAQWAGAAPFSGLAHFIQNIGDGTYAHSGILAIRAAIASGANITYKILYNSHVAMTGAQPAIGIVSVPAMATELLAEGVQRVIVTTEDPERYRSATMPPGVEVWDRDRLVEAQEALAAIAGVTAIIHDQECATEQRRRRKRGLLEDPVTRVVINERVCEGCGDCGVKSNCLSVHPVETEFGRKTQIHQGSCNKDYSCLEGNCPSFVTVRPRSRPGRMTGDVLEASDLPEPELRAPLDTFGMRIVGIGGTGIVTAAQILATAATLDARFVRGMDQTGLAQKGGPVVSDLRISRDAAQQANHLVTGDCDLYLACDPLTAAQPRNLAACDPRRTFAVLSTAITPTGRMVVDPDTPAPDASTVARRVTRRTRSDGTFAFDAHANCRRLFGSDQAANVMLIGAAYQAGALPLTAASIERAIELNGASVEMNVQAFRRGRQLVAEPEALAQAVEAVSPGHPVTPPTVAALAIADVIAAPAGSRLEQLVLRRVDELIAYQDADYARRFADRVAAVRTAERRMPGDRTALTEAAAIGLHKLMAYKDEYEVARLHLDPSFRAQLARDFGPDAEVSFNLQPPALKALGLKGKIGVPGRLGRALFRGLVPLRRLRHTALDPFGRDEVRKAERALIAEYDGLLSEIADQVDERNYDVAVELASLPDLVRGYDEVKLRNVERYRSELEALRPALSSRSPATPDPSRSAGSALR